MKPNLLLERIDKFIVAKLILSHLLTEHTENNENDYLFIHHQPN